MLIHSNVYHHRNTWLHDPYTYSHVYPKRTLLKPHILQAKTVILHHHSTNTTLHSIYILYFYIHGIHFFFFLFFCWIIHGIHLPTHVSEQTQTLWLFVYNYISTKHNWFIQDIQCLFTQKLTHWKSNGFKIVSYKLNTHIHIHILIKHRLWQLELDRSRKVKFQALFLHQFLAY